MSRMSWRIFTILSLRWFGQGDSFFKYVNLCNPFLVPMFNFWGKHRCPTTPVNGTVHSVHSIDAWVGCCSSSISSKYRIKQVPGMYIKYNMMGNGDEI